MGTGQVEIPVWECYQLLREQTLGRLCVVANGYPMAFPVSYRVAEMASHQAPFILLRTRPDGVIASALGPASLEIDHIDDAQGRAWSVIARGSLGPVHDFTGLPVPRPWLQDGRHEWLLLEPHQLSGRRFRRSDGEGFAVDWEVVSG